MKRLIPVTLIAACAFAQDPVRIMVDKIGADPVGVSALAGGSIKGAPYSATIVTETIQVLADGNRIVQKNQGAVARDSQGRMRHEAILPIIGNLSAKNTPKLIFINDPVSGTNYSLNAAEKTFRKMPGLTTVQADNLDRKVNAARSFAVTRSVQAGTVSAIPASRIPAPPPGAGDTIHFDVATPMVGAVGGAIASMHTVNDQMQVKNESLGTKVIDGVVAEGMRSVRTIPAGEIGNDKPIEIVSESWFSQELKTLVYSKRSDPRSGEMIYSLTNISRAEPDASLFSVPADYSAAPESGLSIKMREAGKTEGVVIYKPE